MENIYNIKIPTFFGVTMLSVIIASCFMIFGGVKLQNSNRLLYPPKDLRVSNITDSSFTVSWTTDLQTASNLHWGQKSPNRIIEVSSEKKFTHWITVDSLSPNTEYIFLIENGNETHDNGGVAWRVATANKLDKRTVNIIFGKVTTANKLLLKDALVYLTVSGSNLLSTVTDASGNFNIDIAGARSNNLLGWHTIDENSTLEIHVNSGPFGVASLIASPLTAKPLPLIILGESQIYKIPMSSQSLMPFSEIIMPDGSNLYPGNNID
jgi:hypothetical protein